MGREDSQYCEDWYWAIGDMPSKMTDLEADVIRALRRGRWTWRGITMAAIEVFGWEIDETQMAGEQLCMLAAEILGCENSEFKED